MATEAMVQLLERAVETLESIKHTSKISAAKLEFIEKRQCDSGEGTDASRYIDNWSRSTSAHVNSAQVLEMAKRILENKTTEVMRYSELFAEKDARRMESLTAFFYITYCKGDETMWHYREPSYDELGRLGAYMPSLKQKIRVATSLLKAQFGEDAEEQMDAILGPTPREITIVLEIVRPVGTSFEIVENFKGKCFEQRQALNEVENPKTKFERLDEHTKRFFSENANLTEVEGAEFSRIITEMLVMWPEAREKQGKKRAEMMRHSRRDS